MIEEITSEQTDVKEINTENLYRISKIINNELRLRSNEFIRMNEESALQRKMLKSNAKNLISFIDDKLLIKLNSKFRTQKMTQLRFTLFHYLWLKKMNKTDIGKMFNRDHSTVIYGLKKVDDYLKNNDDIFLRYFNIVNEIIKEYELL